MRQKLLDAAVWVGIFLCCGILAAALAMPVWAGG